MSSPTACNVIFRGKGYHFSPPIPPYDPYLKRNRAALFLMFIGVAGIVCTFRYKDRLGSSTMIYGGAFVFFVIFIFGILWWRKYTSASNIFLSAPRDCTISSTDAEVFYARK